MWYYAKWQNHKIQYLHWIFIKGLSAVSIIQFNHVLNAFRLQCLRRVRPWESAQGLGGLGHQGRSTQEELLRLRVWEVFPVSGRGHHWSQESRNPVSRRWNYVCVNSIKYHIKPDFYMPLNITFGILLDDFFFDFFLWSLNLHKSYWLLPTTCTQKKI